MFNLHPKRMAKIVLEKAMAGQEPKRMMSGGEVGNYRTPVKSYQPKPDTRGNPGDSGNYLAPEDKDEEMVSMTGSPGTGSNYADPEAGDEGEEIDGYAEGGEVGHVAAAEEVLAAFKSGDASALASALKNFIEQCDIGAPEGAGDDDGSAFEGKDIPLDLDSDEDY